MILNDINEQIVKYSKELRLPTFSKEFKEQVIYSNHLDYRFLARSFPLYLR